MKLNVATRKYTLKIEDKKWREVKAYAAVNGVRIRDLIINALDLMLKQK